MKPLLLVLRPEPGCTATVERAERAGFAAVAAPLFVVEPVAWSLPAADHDALLLTSANAVRHAGGGLARLRHLPVHAVGAATAAAARAADLTVATVGTEGAEAALALAAGAGARRLLHLAGEDHRAAAHPGLSIDRRIVYRSVAVEDLPDAAAAVLGQAIVALIHSARAGRLFGRLIDRAGWPRARIGIAAIAQGAADAAGRDWRGVTSAERPDDDALLAAALRLCEDGAR